MSGTDPKSRATSQGESRWIDRYPELGRQPIPVDALFGEECHARERERIFQRCWLFVGRIEEIPAPSGYIVRDIEVCNASILIVRQDTGDSLTAFHNVCRHRLNKLVYDNRGRAARFVCRYHGWTYERTGSLHHIPDEQGFYDIDKKDCGLVPVAVDVWRGFIFINLDPAPRESLMEYLGDVADRLRNYPFEEFTRPVQWSLEVNADWKLGTYTTLDVYHGEHLHILPTLGGRKAARSGSGSRGRPLNFERLGRHCRVSSEIELSLDSSVSRPIIELTAQWGEQGCLRPHVATDHEPNPAAAHSGAWCIFPNLVLGIYSGYCQTFLFSPLALHRSRFTSCYLFRNPTTIRDLAALTAESVIADNVVAGDLLVAERVQEGIRSRAVKHMHLGEGEVAIRHHYRVLMNELGSD